MKRLAIISLLVCPVIMPLPVLAQSYYSDGHSGNAVVLRDPARQSSTDIDAVLFNPAGTTWLKNGFHISVNGIAAWRFIDSQVIGNDKKYRVNNLNITPSVQLAYKKGDWTFSASFGSEGGLGKLQADEGVGLGDAMFGSLVEMCNANFTQFALIYELAHLLGETPDLNIVIDDELRLKSSDYKVRLNNWATRIGASYKINDWLSGYVGAKFIYLHYSSKFHLATEIVRPSTNSLFVPENYFNDALERLNQASMQNESTQRMKELIYSNKEICSTLDEIGNTISSPTKMNQWGVSPIIGLNAHFNRWNLGIKYEFQSILLNDIDGDASFRTPAELSIGASWYATDWLKAAVGSNIFFKTSDVGFDGLKGDTSYSLSGSLTFNLPQNWILSGGYSYYKSIDIFEPLMNFAMAMNPSNRHLYSVGLGYDINENLQFNFGVSILSPINVQTNSNIHYEGFEDLDTSFQTKYEVGRRITIGIGLNYSF